MNKQKLLAKALSSPHNLSISDAMALIELFGFNLSRINGSHHIFVHPDVKEIVNIQDVSGQAKAYQIRQFLKLIEKYNLN